MTDEEQKAIFSKNLNKYIYQSGKQQKEVAHDLGYSPTTFNTWCVGKIIPSTGKIQKIADYFNIGKSDLLDDKTGTYQNQTPKILEYYNSLNDIGKHEATKRVKELTYLPEYSAELKHLMVDAAHEIENTSKEDKEHDEDIMNDENF